VHLQQPSRRRGRGSKPTWLTWVTSHKQHHAGA
jgi:hypothetical protein